MLVEAVAYFHQALLNSTRAQEYLRQRGVYDETAIRHFQIGFSDGSFSSDRLPKGNTPRKRMARRKLQTLGLLDQRGHEPFRPGIVFPINDPEGGIAQLYSRKLSGRLKSKKYHVLLNQRRDVIWNLEGLQGASEIILCKGIMDALTFWVAGYRQVTALLGSDHLTEFHIHTFRALGIKRIMLAFGGKPRDIKHYLTTGKRLQEAGFIIFRIMFPRGFDPNTAARKGPIGQYVDTAELDDLLQPRHDSCSATLDGPKRSIQAPPVPKETVLASTPPAPVHQEAEVEPREEVPPTSCHEPKYPRTDSSTDPLSLETRGDDIHARIEGRQYRIRGLFESHSVDSLRVTVRITFADLVFVDAVELFAHRDRSRFISHAASELTLPEPLLKRDLGQLLIRLETILDDHVREVLTPVTISETDRQAAIDYLKAPNLIKRIREDLEASGLVGEQSNKLVGYLAMTSRKLAKPLAIMVQSTSAAGKSTLLDTLLGFMPPEERMIFSSITRKSLYYMAEQGMKHKILSITEGEGATNASYSIKLLQSEGELSISSTQSSKKGIAAKAYRVEGPVMIALTTTAIDIDEELLNRCLVLTVDESRAQTQAIHQMQRKGQTLEGLLERERFKTTLNLHQNLQRLLRPIHVVNPFAPDLTFLDEKTRLRRDHIKYLTLIQAIAFLHQHQRTIRTVTLGEHTLEYIEATLEDIEIANELAGQVLGVTLDELPPQTRKLLSVIDQMVTDTCERENLPRSAAVFTRRALRRYCQWGDTQLKIHLKRLVEHEYLALAVHQRTHFYECLYNGEGHGGQPFLMGLADTNQLFKGSPATPRSGL